MDSVGMEMCECVCGRVCAQCVSTCAQFLVWTSVEW